MDRRRACIQRRHVSHDLRRAVQGDDGCSPLRYLIEWRVAVASAALKSSHRSISEVAEIVGYGSAAAFSSVFFKVTGRRPGQYRVESAVVERDP
ncbi:helix-turn-helix transcriptional regulator [Variovorax sp. GrIS 2.14]|uniref:helix-turn-helix transcriptional regulator n=1 Tax=Variovorax sp. GrIS 2.14 TaxID=3071709 RepID=UPI0038F6F962